MGLSWHLFTTLQTAAPAMPFSRRDPGIDTDGLAVHILSRRSEHPRSRFAGPSISVARHSIQE